MDKLLAAIKEDDHIVYKLKRGMTPLQEFMSTTLSHPNSIRTTNAVEAHLAKIRKEWYTLPNIHTSPGAVESMTNVLEKYGIPVPTDGPVNLPAMTTGVLSNVATTPALDLWDMYEGTTIAAAPIGSWNTQYTCNVTNAGAQPVDLLDLIRDLQNRVDELEAWKKKVEQKSGHRVKSTSNNDDI